MLFRHTASFASAGPGQDGAPICTVLNPSAPREMTISDLNQFLRSCGDVRGISYTPIY